MFDKTQFYIFASSRDSIIDFPTNQNAKFRIKIEKPLNLDQYWYVALCQVRFLLTSQDPSRSLSINCNICSPSFIAGKSDRVLRTVSRRGIENIYKPYYHPVSQRYIESIEFNISNSQGLTPDFNSHHPVELTLHFKRSVNPQYI